MKPFQMSCDIFSAPTKGMATPRVLICSDDQLVKLNVHVADHIIHYDLPEDFETFSFRYCVFIRSHCQLPVSFFKLWFNPFFQNNLLSLTLNEKPTNKKNPPSIPSSTIFYVLENACEKQTILILSLYARKCKLNITASLRSQLLVSLTTKFVINVVLRI